MGDSRRIWRRTVCVVASRWWRHRCRQGDPPVGGWQVELLETAAPGTEALQTSPYANRVSRKQPIVRWYLICISPEAWSTKSSNAGVFRTSTMR